MRPFKDLIFCTVIVMAGILLFAQLKDLLSCKDKSAEEFAMDEPSAIAPPEASLFTPLTPEAKKKPATTSNLSAKSHNERLTRFEQLKKKVLLNNEESIERERLLSHLKTIESVATHLTDPSKRLEMKERLSLIDHLEDAVSWNDNPVREEALNHIEGVIRSERFNEAEGDAKRQFVGDKIELLTILSQQSPKKAALLIEEAKGTKLESILKYAVRRLNLKNIKSEE